MTNSKSGIRAHGRNHKYIVEKNSLGQTPIALAAQKNMGPLIHQMITLGGSFMEPDYDGNTPLHHAVIHNALDAMQVLLTHGANTNTTNRRGETPQDIARKYNRNAMIDKLQPIAQGVIVPNRELH